MWKLEKCKCKLQTISIAKLLQNRQHAQTP